MSPTFNASIASYRHYGADAPLFEGIQLTLHGGDILVVAGPGGCGKTTLCHCLSNVIPAFYRDGELDGCVSVNGTPITGLPLARSAQLAGLLLQSPERHLFNLSVAEDIAFGPENLAHPPAQIQKTILELAGRLHLEPLLARAPHTLSSGETQRAALAATLALNPPVLVFDQPTAHLDHGSREDLYRLLTRLAKEEGKIIVVAETDLRLADLQPLATQVLALPGKGRPRPTAHEPPRRRGQNPSLVGRPDPGGSRLDGENQRIPALQVAGLAFSYARDRPLLQNANLVLRQGECAALVGDNGSGKTTLLRTLAGLCRPQGGTIRLLGRDITRLAVSRRSALVAYLPQHFDSLFCHDSVVAEVAPAPVHNRVDGMATARGWLRQAGLDHLAESHPLTLAHGERYRLALALLLARLSPALLLLDEPTGVLDQEETGILGRLIASFCAAGGAALIVTHDLACLAGQGIVQRTLRITDLSSEAALVADTNL